MLPNKQPPEQSAQTWEYTFFLQRQQLISLVTQGNIFDLHIIIAFNDSMQADGSYQAQPSDPPLLKNIKTLITILVQLQALSSLLVDDLTQLTQSGFSTDLFFKIGKILLKYRSVKNNAQALMKNLKTLDAQVHQISRLPELKTLIHKIFSETIGPQLSYFSKIIQSKDQTAADPSDTELEALSESLNTLNKNILDLIDKCEHLDETHFKKGVKDKLLISTKLIKSLHKSHRNLQSLVTACKRKEISTAKSLLYESLEQIGHTVIKLQQLNTNNHELIITGLNHYIEKLVIEIQPILITMMSSLEMIEGHVGIEAELLQKKLATICQLHEKLTSQMNITTIVTHYPYWKERLKIRQERLNKLAGKIAQAQHIKHLIGRTPIRYETSLQDLILLRKQIIHSELIHLGPYEKKLAQMIYERIGLHDLVSAIHELAQKCLAMQAKLNYLTEAEKLQLNENLTKLEKLHQMESELRENFNNPNADPHKVLSYDRTHETLAYDVFNFLQHGKIKVSQEECDTILALYDHHQTAMTHEYQTTLDRIETIEQQLILHEIPFKKASDLTTLHRELISLTPEAFVLMSPKQLRDLADKVKNQPGQSDGLLTDLKKALVIKSTQKKSIAILKKYRTPEHYNILLLDQTKKSLSILANILNLSPDQVKNEIEKSKTWTAYWTGNSFIELVDRRIAEINHETTKEIALLANRIPQQIHSYLTPTAPSPPGKAKPPIAKEALPEAMMRIRNTATHTKAMKLSAQLFKLKDTLPTAKKHLLQLLDERYIDPAQKEALLASKNAQGEYLPHVHDALLIRTVKSALNTIHAIEKLLEALLKLDGEISIRNIYADRKEIQALFNQINLHLSELFYCFDALRNFIPDDLTGTILSVPLVAKIYHYIQPSLLLLKTSFQKTVTDPALLEKINGILTPPAPIHKKSGNPPIKLQSCINHLDKLITEKWPGVKRHKGLYKFNAKDTPIKKNILRMRNLLHNAGLTLNMTVDIANKKSEPALLEILSIAIKFKDQIPSMPPEQAKKMRLFMQEINETIQPFFTQLVTWRLLAEHQLGIQSDFFEKANKELCLKYEEYALQYGFHIASHYPYTKEKIARLESEIALQNNNSKDLLIAVHALSHLHSLKQGDLSSFAMPFTEIVTIRAALKKLPSATTEKALTTLNKLIYKNCGLDKLDAEIVAVKEEIARRERAILENHGELTRIQSSHETSPNTAILEKEIVSLKNEKMTLQETLTDLRKQHAEVIGKLDQFDSTQLPFKYENGTIKNTAPYTIDLIECKKTDFTSAILAIDHAQAHTQTELLWLQQEKTRQQISLDLSQTSDMLIKRKNAMLHSEDAASLHQPLLEDAASLHQPLLEDAINRANHAFMITHASFKEEFEAFNKELALKYDTIIHSSASAERKQQLLITLQREQAARYTQMMDRYQHHKKKALSIDKRALIATILAHATNKKAAEPYQNILKKSSDDDLIKEIIQMASREASNPGRYVRNKFNITNLHDQLYTIIRLLQYSVPAKTENLFQQKRSSPDEEKISSHILSQQKQPKPQP